MKNEYNNKKKFFLVNIDLERKAKRNLLLKVC